MLSYSKSQLSREPNLLLVDGIRTSKQPSALTNPEIQLGSIVKLSWYITGLSTGIYPANSDFNMSDKPKFKDALILTISFKPVIVRWALLKFHCFFK
jgi:hypothetical protein